MPHIVVAVMFSQVGVLQACEMFVRAFGDGKGFLTLSWSALLYKVLFLVRSQGNAPIDDDGSTEH